MLLTDFPTHKADCIESRSTKQNNLFCKRLRHRVLRIVSVSVIERGQISSKIRGLLHLRFLIFIVDTQGENLKHDG